MAFDFSGIFRHFPAFFEALKFLYAHFIVLHVCVQQCVLLCVPVCSCVGVCLVFQKRFNAHRLVSAHASQSLPSSPVLFGQQLGQHQKALSTFRVGVASPGAGSKKNILKFNLSSWTEIKLHTSTFGAHVPPCPAPSCLGGKQSSNDTEQTRHEASWGVRSIVI